LVKRRKRKKNLVKTLFSQLSKNMVQAFYEKYRIDFQMFEYDICDYVKYASESEGLMPDVIEVCDIQNETEQDKKMNFIKSDESDTQAP
jgi:hypothetical protein